MKSLSILVKGKVQGVYFRQYALQRALSVNLNGYVVNQPDGTVRIEVEGDEKAIDKFLEFCHRGSPQAHVESVDVMEVPMRSLEKFKIEKKWTIDN